MAGSPRLQADTETRTLCGINIGSDRLSSSHAERHVPRQRADLQGDGLLFIGRHADVKARTKRLHRCPDSYFFCSCAPGDGSAVERFFFLAPVSIADNLR